MEETSIKESKDKSRKRSKTCYCAPTTHEGSFRCRLYHKTSSNNKNSLKLNSTKGIVEFKPQYLRFDKVFFV